MNLLIISVTHKVPLSREITLNGNLFVGTKTLKLAATALPQIILIYFCIILSNYYNIPVHRFGFSLRRGWGRGVFEG